jgi:hypothetical protein
MKLPLPRLRRPWGLLSPGSAALLMLAGCTTYSPARLSPTGLPAPHEQRSPAQHYGNAAPAPSFDSATASCRHNPSACLAAVGKEVASAAAVVKLALDATTQQAIETELTRCADMARSEVLLRHEGDFEELTPNAEECNQPPEAPAALVVPRLGIIR